jgi:hypothetical protein
VLLGLREKQRKKRLLRQRSATNAEENSRSACSPRMPDSARIASLLTVNEGGSNGSRNK